MKKKLIFSTAIAALFSASAVLAGGPEMVVMAPSPFDGFYLGGSGSFHQTGFDIDSNVNIFSNIGIIPFTIPFANQNGGDSSTDAYYGVRGGWGRVFMNRWYAGIEGFADFGNANGSITNSTSPAAALAFLTPVVLGTSTSLTNSARVGNDWGVAARLGILLSPTTLGYAKLGAEWANVKASVNSGATVFGFPLGPLFSGSNSSDESGFLWGFGVEQFIWRDVVSLFAEYTFVSVGSVSTSNGLNFAGIFETFFNPDAFSGLLANNTVSADISSFTGGLNFHFGRNWF